ncbi:MAG TPA: lysophospholipid acyltransferase family protein [Acidobacteriaceae bacterium]|nr:lysophospholipid acyltransferase family protein [Acidobacteriaceae bacterium]
MLQEFLSAVRGLILILIWTVLALPAALVVFPWTLITRNTDVLLRVGFWIARAGLPLVGLRVVVHGLEDLPHGASIVMANHSSNLDPPVLIPLLPGRVVIYLKASLMRIPVLGYAMRLAGFIPVLRDGSLEGAKASSAAAQRELERGSCLVLFPEGTRSRDGSLLPFKKGPFFLAMDSGVPVVPVSIVGATRLLPKGSLNLKRGTITVTFHAPLDPAEYGQKEELMAAVRDAMEAGLRTPERTAIVGSAATSR